MDNDYEHIQAIHAQHAVTTHNQQHPCACVLSDIIFDAMVSGVLAKLM